MPDDDIVVHISNLSYISNVFSLEVSELNVDWNVTTIWSIFRSDLLESYT